MGNYIASFHLLLLVLLLRHNCISQLQLAGGYTARRCHSTYGRHSLQPDRLIATRAGRILHSRRAWLCHKRGAHAQQLELAALGLKQQR